MEFRKSSHKKHFYRFLSVFTIVLLVLQLAIFFFELTPLPAKISFFWMATLFLYFLMNQVFQYAGVNCLGKDNKGEFFAAMVIGTFLLMEAVNLVRLWIFNLPAWPLPPAMFETALEAIVLYVFSIVGSVLITKRNGRR